MLICISARFRHAQIVGASPVGIKIRIDEPVELGEPVMLTHVELEPVAGRIWWTEELYAGVEFDPALSSAEFTAWFGDFA